MPVKKRVVHHRFGIAPAEQRGNRAVAFAVERREEEDEQGQRTATQSEARPKSANPPEQLLKGVHRAGEIEGNQSAEHTEENGRWYALHTECLVHAKSKHGLSTSKGVGDAGGREARHEQGQERCHRQVEHQHFKGKHKSRYGCFEYARYRTRRAAAYEEHEAFVVEVEGLADSRAYGRAREHDGRLGSDAAAETDGQGRRHDARPAVVSLNPTLSARDGIKNFRHAMANVVAHHIFYE